MKLTDKDKITFGIHSSKEKLVVLPLVGDNIFEDFNEGVKESWEVVV